MPRFVPKPSWTTVTSEARVSLLGYDVLMIPGAGRANVMCGYPRQGSPFLSLFLFLTGHLSQKEVHTLVTAEGRESTGWLLTPGVFKMKLFQVPFGPQH